jgi:hypothetical protein
MLKNYIAYYDVSDGKRLPYISSNFSIVSLVCTDELPYAFSFSISDTYNLLFSINARS